MATKVTTVDITRRLEWEVSKEKFEACGGEDVNDKFCVSPNFDVKIDDLVSNWNFTIGLIPGDRGMIGLGKDFKSGINATGVYIVLSLRSEDVSLKVEVEGIGIKAELGYIPGKPCKDVRGKIKMISKIEDFNGRSKKEERSCTVHAGTKENILKSFHKNKITVVSTLRFYIDRNDYIKKNERDEMFVTHLRSISNLDALADFTVICGDREFKCHRNILASRSTVFHRMILNEGFEGGRKTSVTIQEASPDMVEAMLEFIAKGEVPRDIEEMAIDLIALADFYDLKDLMQICESSLVDNLTVETVIETLIAIDRHIPSSQHRKKILDFIKEEAADVVKSSHWKKFLEKYPDLVTEVFLSLAPVKASAN